MPEPTLTELLPIASAAVDRASQMIRSMGPGTVTMKGDRDPATEVDFAIERELRSFLAEAAPDVDFLGEEEGRVSQGRSGLVWTLDPVDGTVNFMHGIPLCGVSLGLVCDGQPALGVVDLPFLGQRYSAVLDGGAYCGDERLRVSQKSDLKEAVVALGDYAVGAGAPERNKERLRITNRLAGEVSRLRMFGAASVDLVWLARGLLDSTVMLSNKPWDTAAGVLIAREAGALVLDRYGNPHTLKSKSTVAISPRLATSLIPLLV